MIYTQAVLEIKSIYLFSLFEENHQKKYEEFYGTQ
jgi:hypothetical protein